ncbi:unnamed protein product [Phytophthora fragariaefolia]|uniref:Unnamed protein product n=1 Tax=Phytophthora fragariaefolia TaxID=1490495 RepID=A0A9W7CWM4_9STRA|nr:unnamed protein product [Phytophthora fragariaefolia]
MPFGLKHATLIYQSVINNCLWGSVRLPPDEESLEDPEVLDFLNLSAKFSSHSETKQEIPTQKVPILPEQMTVFQRNIGNASHEGPERTPVRITVLAISVSLPKREFGKLTIPYLSHEVCTEGIRATPKIAKGVLSLLFPSTIKGDQSFLGRLNNYNNIIEDFPIVEGELYELRYDQVRAGRDLTRAQETFELLKLKTVSTPLPRHPDRTKPLVIIPHASIWAACAVLVQKDDGVTLPVMFKGLLNEYELRPEAESKGDVSASLANNEDSILGPESALLSMNGRIMAPRTMITMAMAMTTRNQARQDFKAEIKECLREELNELSRSQVYKIAKVAGQMKVRPLSAACFNADSSPRHGSKLRLVVPGNLRPDMLQYAPENTSRNN